jgi:hypothetical protein
MPCITPNHDMAITIDESDANLVVTRFYSERPQLFRRISKGMDGATVFDAVLEPIVIGETGHVIQYELRVVPPPDGKFIDLYPAHDDRTGANAARNQLLLRCGFLVRLWDPISGRRWQIELALCATCFPVQTGQDERLDAENVVITGLVPPPFQAAINYAALHLLKSAMRHFTLPGNFFLEPPTSTTIRIEALQIDGDIFRIDAQTLF